jgi:predicted acylesterase/phospholipase RssA
MAARDVALVLSGGGMNATLLETGFLQQLRADSLWERVGWIYGTSAGALAGTMAAVDRLDDLERFVLDLRPDEAFRPNRLWQLPLTGLHDYTLPATIAERVTPLDELGAALAASPLELVVCVTELEPFDGGADDHGFERMYSSRTTPPAQMVEAVLASAAISALVLPVRIGEAIATDGGWVRNFPLGHAYDNADVGAIVAYRHVSRYPPVSGENLARMRRRLEPFRAVPAVRALMGELQASEERRGRGEPAHLPEMIGRLMRVAIARNTAMEERHAREKDVTVTEIGALRRDVAEIARRNALPWRRRRAAAEVAARFAEARLPFRHDRRLPAVIVHGDPGELALDNSFRGGLEWPEERKEELLALGRRLGAEALERLAAAEAQGADVAG